MFYRQKHYDQRLIAFATTVALHALAIILLLQYPPVRPVLAEAAPIMVSLLASPKIAEKTKELPKPLPVKHKAKRIKPAQPQPLVSTASDAPAPVAVPTPAPQPPAPVDNPPPPRVVARAANPAPLVPPSFNANYLMNPAPHYPALSRRMGEQGKVILRVLVNPNGAAEKVELRSGSGSDRLDNAALETVRHWRFVPAREGDQPVAAWVLIPIIFTLKG